MLTGVQGSYGATDGPFLSSTFYTPTGLVSDPVLPKVGVGPQRVGVGSQRAEYLEFRAANSFLWACLLKSILILFLLALVCTSHLSALSLTHSSGVCVRCGHAKGTCIGPRCRHRIDPGWLRDGRLRRGTLSSCTLQHPLGSGSGLLQVWIVAGVKNASLSHILRTSLTKSPRSEVKHGNNQTNSRSYPNAEDWPCTW